MNKNEKIAKLEEKCRLQFNEIRRMRETVRNMEIGAQQLSGLTDYVISLAARKYGCFSDGVYHMVLPAEDMKNVLDQNEINVKLEGEGGEKMYYIMVSKKYEPGVGEEE